MNPAIPVTPEQIAGEVLAARRAGAAIAHVPMVAQAVVLGGQVRVGLEDNLLHLARGVLAPGNAALVERAARIVEALGAAVASPAETRAMLARYLDTHPGIKVAVVTKIPAPLGVGRRTGGYEDQELPEPTPSSDAARAILPGVLADIKAGAPNDAMAKLASLERRWLARHDLPVGLSAVVLASKPS